MNSVVLPSLYIPRLRNDTNESDIYKVFETYFGSALIQYIDLVDREDNLIKKSYKMGFIHFKENASLPNDHPFALKLDTLENGGDVKLLIDDSHYWIIRKNIGVKRDSNPFDPTSPISKEVESTPRIKTYEPTIIKTIDYSSKIPYPYPFIEVQKKENCRILQGDVEKLCETVSNVIERIWGVTYDMMDYGGCMWKCKYLGFNFVIDLWTFCNKGEIIMLLEIRNIDCDDGTFKDLRGHIFQHIN